MSDKAEKKKAQHLPDCLSARSVGELMGVSPAAATKIMREHANVKPIQKLGYQLSDVIFVIAKMVREAKAWRARHGDEPLTYKEQREKEQAAGLVIDNSEKRGQLISRDQVEQELGGVFGLIRARIKEHSNDLVRNQPKKVRAAATSKSLKMLRELASECQQYTSETAPLLRKKAHELTGTKKKNG